jgi:alpha-tubulin suppressor-like RCC1 family protein
MKLAFEASMIAVVLAALATACGGDDDPNGASQPMAGSGSGPTPPATPAEQAGAGGMDAPAPRVESPTEPESGVTSVSVGGGFVCRIVTSGDVECWGGGGNGTLGHGYSMSSQTPIPVADLSSPIVQIAAGGSHTCALATDGGVQCWGTNFHGELGNGEQAPASTVVSVSDLGRATAIAAGGSLSCALLEDGSVSCWGLSGEGWDGSGPGEGVFPPDSILKSTVHTPVPGVAGATAIAVGSRHACAIAADERVLCWGDNAFGQLGDGTMERSASGVPVSGELRAQMLATSQDSTCALTTDGELACWGSGFRGQLGYQDDRDHDRSLTPVMLEGLDAVVALDGGAHYFCAVLDDGNVRCWGANGSGMLGDHTEETSLTPVQVQGVSGAVAVSCGTSTVCAILEGEQLQCWGFVGPWR